MKSENKKFSRKKLALATTLMFLLPETLCAAESIEVDIERQAVGSALFQLAAKSGMQIVLEQDVRKNIQLPSIQGSYTVPSALNKMLEGTGLTYEFTSKDLILIKVQEEANPDDSTESDKGDIDVDEEVVVTGSRLKLLPSETTSKIIVLDAQALADTGESTLEQALRQLPQNLGGGTEIGGVNGGSNFDNNAFNGAVNVTGASTINLRGVGERGTLVLVNGRRLGQSGVLGGFSDVSTIPLALVERVEIQLDGASSVYGADAVGGVVNIILKKGEDIQGVTVQVRRDAPFASGGDSYTASVSGALGWDRGSLFSTLTYTRFNPRSSAGLGQFAERLGTFTDQGTIVGRRGAELDDISDLAGEPVFSASIPTGQDGTALTAADFVSTANNPVISDGLLAGLNFIPAREAYTLSFGLNQNLTDDIELTSTLRYSPRETISTRAQNTLSLDIDRDNPFNPFPGERIVVERNFFSDSPVATTITNTDNWGASIGLTGSFGDLLPSWEWDVSVNYTLSDVNSVVEDQLSFGLLEDLARGDDAIINVFADSVDISAAILERSAFDTENEETGVEFFVRGDLFSLPHGEVSAVFGGAWRESSIDIDFEVQGGNGSNFITTSSGLGILPGNSGEIANRELEEFTSLGVDPATIVFRSADDTASGLGASRTFISSFAEFNIPLLADLPLIKSWNASVAGRYESTDDVILGDSSSTWSLGTRWQIIDGLSVRARKGTSYITPTLSQGSIPTQIFTGFLFGAPPPNGLFTPVGSIRGGRANLLPETATTVSYGVDYDAGWLPGLQLGVNYNRISYLNRLDTNSGFIASTLFSSSLDEIFPDLYLRAEDGLILATDTRAFNVASQLTSGYDFSASYVRDTEVGEFLFSMNTAIQDRSERRRSALDTSEIENDVRERTPKYRHSGRLSWSHRGLRTVLNAQKTDDIRRLVTRDDREAVVENEPQLELDLLISYDFDGGFFGDLPLFEQTQLRLGINNITNKSPQRRELFLDTGKSVDEVSADGLSTPTLVSGTGDRSYYLEVIKRF